MTSNHSQDCMNNNCNPLVILFTVINSIDTLIKYCRVDLCPVGAWIEANHFCLEVWGNGLTPVNMHVAPVTCIPRVDSTTRFV